MFDNDSLIAGVALRKIYLLFVLLFVGAIPLL